MSGSGPARRQYLVSTTYHTPSGPLHLGHIGGPFLNADVIAKNLEFDGHHVMRVSATDARESYVLLTARSLNVPPSQVARYYHGQAERALTALDITQDAFLDTHDPALADMYVDLSAAVENEIVERGLVSVRPVTHLLDAETRQYLVGGFITGRCPRCNEPVAGTSCEECGLWFSLRDLRNPGPRPGAGTHAVVDVNGTEAVLDVSESLTAEHVHPRFPATHHHLLDDYLSWNGPVLPLTHPLGWGVPWHHHGVSPAAVHSSYAIGAHASMRLIGQHCVERWGTDPFDIDSDVVRITTGGLDATLPWMFHVAFLRSYSRWRPMDIHVLTEFMTLSGEKFSTSRGHAIWAHDYVASGLSTDALRFYMACISPSVARTNFDIDGFDQRSRWLEDRLGTRAVGLTPGTARRALSVHSPAHDRALGSLQATRRHLHPTTFDLALWAAEFTAWVDADTSATLLADDPGLWLEHVADACYPVMPRWSHWAWTHAEALGRVLHRPTARDGRVGLAADETLNIDPNVVRAMVGRRAPTPDGSDT